MNTRFLSMVLLSKGWALLYVCLIISYYTNAQSIITVKAGDGVTHYTGDGYPATAYSLAEPYSIHYAQGSLFIANHADHRIRKLTLTDTLSTLAGNGTLGYSGNGGPASAAIFNKPVGITTDSNGNIYVTDWLNNVVRKIDASTNIIDNYCGSTLGGFGGDSGLATAARLETPLGACMDKEGNLYIPDFGNHRIRKVSASTGIITTVVGTGVSGFSGDENEATTAKISFPIAVAVDSENNLYISDWGNNRVRKVLASTGVINTIAGNGSATYTGDGGLAVFASINEARGLCIDKLNNLFIADFGNNVVRMVAPSGYISTVAGCGLYGYSGHGGRPLDAKFNGPNSICIDEMSNMYIADGGNSVVWKVTPGYTQTTDVTAEAWSSQVYPNPANVSCKIVCNQPINHAQLTVCNVLGQIYLEQPILGRQVELQVADWPNGLYTITIRTENGIHTSKMLVQHGW